MKEKKHKNSHLTKAQYYGDKNGNEFYTPYDIIAEEVQEISAFFDGKVVYNNCDDGARSNFYKYFKDNFKALKLKKLVATGFDENGVGHKYEYDGTDEHITECDGDYAANIGILEQCDVVCTNPPFSVYSRFVKMLTDRNVSYLIIGSPIKHYAFWKDLKAGTLVQGRSRAGFRLKRDDGLKQQECIWFSNILPEQKPKYQRKLTAKFADIPHTFYDGTFEGEKVLFIKKAKQIPCDYDGFIAVPVSYGLYDLSDFDVYYPAAPSNEICRRLGLVDGERKFIRIIVKKKVDLKETDKNLNDLIVFVPNTPMA